MKKLIETDPEYKDNKGRTPLHIAFQCGEEGVIKALFETYKFDEGHFHVAFDFAIEYKMFNIVDLLLKTHQYDPNHRNSKGRISLHTAAEHGSSEVMKKLIKTYEADPKCKDDEGRTPLACAVANGKRATAKLLIDEYKCDLQCRDSRDYNLLHLAAMNVRSGMVEPHFHQPPCTHHFLPERLASGLNSAQHYALRTVRHVKGNVCNYWLP